MNLTARWTRALLLLAVGCGARSPGSAETTDASVLDDVAAQDALDAPAEPDTSAVVDVPQDRATPRDVAAPRDVPAATDVPSSTPEDPATRTQSAVCARWNADLAASQGHGAWMAGADSCASGTLPSAIVDDAVRLTNAFRWLAGLTPVGIDARETQAAQACAVLIERNGMLNHTPPMTWTCWSALGYEGTSHSNISGGGGATTAASAIANWIDDSRDISGTLGHRRWMLFPQLGPIGYGQSSRYACLYVLGTRGSGSKPWVAWPNEGVVPLDAVTSIWSFSSARVSLTSPTVTVTRDGAPVTVSAMLRAPNYGDPTVSWTMPAAVAGATYHVRVTGAAGPAVEYDVRPVRCR